jgi:hypothetical protein
LKLYAFGSANAPPVLCATSGGYYPGYTPYYTPTSTYPTPGPYYPTTSMSCDAPLPNVFNTRLADGTTVTVTPSWNCPMTGICGDRVGHVSGQEYFRVVTLNVDIVSSTPCGPSLSAAAPPMEPPMGSPMP